MKPEYLYIHTEGASHGFDAVNAWHKSQDFPKSSLGYYCGYHYYCDLTGKRIQARKDTDIGAHCVGYNEKSLAYCSMGNGDTEQLTVNQRHDLRLWIKEKMIEYGIPPDKVKGHRWADSAKAQGKTCPGKNLTDKEIFEMANWKAIELEAREKYDLAEKNRKEAEEKMKSAMTKLIELLQLKVEYLLQLMKIKK